MTTRADIMRRIRLLDDPTVIARTRRDFEETHVRGSGPGGQHRNKVATGVRLVDKPTGLWVVATDSRSQADSRRAAFLRLMSKVVDHYLSSQEEERRVNLGWAQRVRTYNEPADRVTDHRTGTKASYRCTLDGDLDPLISALLAAEGVT